MKRNTYLNTNPGSINPIVQSNTSKESECIDFIDELLFNDMDEDAMKHIIISKIKYPENTAICLREADIHFKLENYSTALSLYSLLKGQESSPKRRISLAVKYINCKKLEQANEIAEELKSHKSVDISSRAYSLLADISFLNQSYKNMYRWSREALKRNPFIDSFAEKFFLAIELTNNHFKSIPFYERVLDENPYSSTIWLHLSKCHRKSGFDMQAQDCLDMVQTIKADS